MPYRIVAEEYWSDADLELSLVPWWFRVYIRATYVSMWTMADDAGMILASLSALWKKTFLWETELRAPIELGGERIEKPMQYIVDQLVNAGKVVLVEVEGREYWWLKNLLKNQTKRDLKFIHPPPPPEVVRAHLTPSDAAKYLLDLEGRRLSHKGGNHDRG